MTEKFKKLSAKLFEQEIISYAYIYFRSFHQILQRKLTTLLSFESERALLFWFTCLLDLSFLSLSFSPFIVIFLETIFGDNNRDSIGHAFSIL